jgi:hypothetical protein
MGEKGFVVFSLEFGVQRRESGDESLETGDGRWEIVI